VDETVGLESPAWTAGVKRFSHEAMATVFEVQALHPDATYAAQAAHAAFDLVDRLERELTRFLPNSDVGRINALAAGQSTRVSPSTMDCLLVARQMYDVTGGAFDVSIGTGLPSLELAADESRVRASTGGVRIDLGGIGKGHAVDLMGELLEDWGIEAAVVHGGFSSVLALGAPAAQEGWPLTLSDPGPPIRVLVRLARRDTALGASGVRKGGHIVDPRTGKPAAGRRAAWAVLPRQAAHERSQAGCGGPRRAAAAAADALATAFMLMRLRDIGALCAASPGLEAWVLPEPARSGGPPEALHFGTPGSS